MFNVVLAYGADEPGTEDFNNSAQIATRNTRLYGLTVFNQSSGTLYARIYDSSAAISDSAAADYIAPVYANNFLTFGWAGGRKYGKGVYVEAASAVDASAVATGQPFKFTWDKMDGPIL